MQTEPTVMTGSVLWPDPATGPWLVQIDWRMQHGVPTPIGLSLKNRDLGGWLTQQPPPDAVLPRVDGRLLRALPFGRLAAASRRNVQDVNNLTLEVFKHEADALATGADRYAGVDLEDWLRGTADFEQRAAAFANAPRGRDLGDDHYRLVAEVYAAALRDGLPPTQAVMKAFTCSKSNAAKRVARARLRGFLPRHPGRGRTGTAISAVNEEQSP